MAILLHDELMYKHFLEVYRTEVVFGLLKQQVEKSCYNIASKAKLSLLSCFQLASKMNSSYAKIEISKVC